MRVAKICHGGFSCGLGDGGNFPIFSAIVRTGFVYGQRSRFTRFHLARRSRQRVHGLTRSPRVNLHVVHDVTPSVCNRRSVGATLTLSLFKNRTGGTRNGRPVHNSVGILLLKSPNATGDRFLGCVRGATRHTICAANRKTSTINLATDIHGSPVAQR